MPLLGMWLQLQWC